MAFVWTIELGTGKWKVGSGIRRSDGINIVTNIIKVILGMGMQFTWPFARGLAVAAAFIWPNWRTMLQVRHVDSVVKI